MDYSQSPKKRKSSSTQSRYFYPLGVAYCPDLPIEPVKSCVGALPTDAVPGTMEKMVVLQKRLEAGLPLHADGDEKWDWEPTELDNEYDRKLRETRLER